MTFEYDVNYLNLIKETLEHENYNAYIAKKNGNRYKIIKELDQTLKPTLDIFLINTPIKIDINNNISLNSSFKINDFTFFYDKTVIDNIKKNLTEEYYNNNYKNDININLQKRALLKLSEIDEIDFNFTYDFDKFKDIFLLNIKNFIHLVLLTKVPKGFAEAENDVIPLYTDIDFYVLSNIQTFIKNVSFYDTADYKDRKRFEINNDHNIYFENDEKKLNVHIIILSAPMFHSWPTKYNFNLCDYKLYNIEEFSKSEIEDDNNEFINLYYENIKIKLLPIFKKINDYASFENKPAFVSMPGIGLGMFIGSMSSKKKLVVNALIYSIYKLLNENNFKEIKLFRLDLSSGPAKEHPFSEKIQEINFKEFHYTGKGKREYKFKELEFGTKIIIESVSKTNISNIVEPEKYSNEVKDCSLYRIVAGDAISYPGNDMYINSKDTDEGLIGGSSNLMGKVVNTNVCYGEFKSFARNTNDRRIATFPCDKPNWYLDWDYVCLKRKLGKINIIEY